MAALWFVFLLPLITFGQSQSTSGINQTDLQAAMADMRARSYHGFVILLKILNSMPNSLQTSDLTFLMPNDEELSQFSITPDHLQDFILSHSIPTPLVINQLLRFPNGSLVPSSVPNRMISITNSRRSGMFLNNARIITPNVCISSSIRCHGISAALEFGHIIPNHQALGFKDSAKKSNIPKPTSSVKHKSIPPSK
ncbi:fasciclin-like arabinogalactan protein 19 [Neltuma alba]|uniref:fasciclin-like arabinogalactan protein 19 n=1 Tax=Neltuma alba TaxID=207710 RepID=UPI0010A2FC9D|nr:fasciclin-like arabinogalactan protein 19 [Prosopis alba]